MNLNIESNVAHEDKILLVDDNPDDLQLLLKLLSGKNYQLYVAKDGKSAVEIAKEVEPSLILLDIVMCGEIDGFSVCKILKEDFDNDIRPAVIFHSGLDDLKDKIKGFSMEGVDYISKPFQAEEVIARVNTQLKLQKLERELKRKNEQLEGHNQRILEVVREGIIGVDYDGLINFCNPAAKEMTSYKDLHGLDFHKLIYREDQLSDSLDTGKNLSELFEEQALAGGGESTFERADKTTFPVDWSYTAVFKDQLTKALIVFKDISIRKKQQQMLNKILNELEDQKEKITQVTHLNSLGEMASGFAHEINQPLTAINTYAQFCIRLLKYNDAIKVEELSKTLEKIAIQAERAGEITSRIRCLSKKPIQLKEKINCNKLIQDVVKLAEIDAKKFNIGINLELIEELPTIYCDPVQIQQVLLNLVRNGMEAMTHHKSVAEDTLTIKTEPYNRMFIKVSVIDHGIGVKGEDLKKLFMPFFTTKNTGVGIGLSVCQSIVQGHGGRLVAENNADQGMTFWMTLPVYK